MPKFKLENVIIQTNDRSKINELKLRGFEEVRDKPKKLEKKDKKASSE